ncbi:uncharacterized protein PRCAT00006344001 [Priceomyces carsonii]|uniref:uncharacterized protein n=1 Tax=Priceomyces carsonii TaxID=28549 RepID=UPI002EDB2278|nr:unnamed protein product [Priceomyces carsonii]
MLESSSITWEAPSKKIYDTNDLKYFKRSIAFARLQRAFNDILTTVKGYDVPKGALKPSIVTRKKENIPPPLINGLHPPVNEESPRENESSQLDGYDINVVGIVKVLKEFDKLIDETPPLKGPRRFGNLARRKWQEKLVKEASQLLEIHLSFPQGINKEDFLVEFEYYLVNSFGSEVRLDYGTGHELLFLACVGSLLHFGFIQLNNKDKRKNSDSLSLIFATYYDLVRRLIIDYSLEPAGSHGVWGLDDHFHFIYILGAAQFNGNKSAPPVQQVLTNTTINTYMTSNFYVNAISFIYKIKLGPFNEHSPIIFDIHSTVATWSKVLTGLIKMYDVEVLGKFPVVQHFWFGGELYPWRDIETNKEFPVFKKDADEDNVEFMNDNKGIKTTKNNISMTAAPWALNNPPSSSSRMHGRSN